MANKNKSGLQKIVHFIGIGGIGISALARWFLAQNKLPKGQKRPKNWAIFGSDIAPSGLLQKLKNEGVKVKIGHKKGYLSPKTALVIYNQAIPAHNPELSAAKKLGIPILSYPQALGRLSRKYKTIAIAGAHGKSTTTALASLVLIRAGFDPTVIIGTKLKEFAPPAGGKNFRNGREDWLIIEADEFHESFLNYSPTYAVVTNIDKEHLDYYKNFKNIKKAFLKFIGNIKTGGILIANRDNKELFGLWPQIKKISKQNKIKVLWYSSKDKTASKIRRVLQIPGSHNVSNAMAVYTLARSLGINEKIILKALHGYRGAWRRMEYRGDMIYSLQPTHYKLSISVYDDYAHHPTEIKATLQAFREKYPKSKIICVFQPHQAERLRLLFKDFTNAFNEADYLVLLPIYKVAGRDKIYKQFTSQKLAQAIPHSIYLSNPKKIKDTIASILQTTNYQLKTIVVMMGAGDIVKYTELLLK